jgi:hypothetical protein
VHDPPHGIARADSGERERGGLRGFGRPIRPGWTARALGLVWM